MVRPAVAAAAVPLAALGDLLLEYSRAEGLRPHSSYGVNAVDISCRRYPRWQGLWETTPRLRMMLTH